MEAGSLSTLLYVKFSIQIVQAYKEGTVSITPPLSIGLVSIVRGVVARKYYSGALDMIAFGGYSDVPFLAEAQVPLFETGILLFGHNTLSVYSLCYR